jgi:hypothetical protein
MTFTLERLAITEQSTHIRDEILQDALRLEIAGRALPKRHHLVAVVTDDGHEKLS